MAAFNLCWLMIIVLVYYSIIIVYYSICLKEIRQHLQIFTAYSWVLKHEQKMGIQLMMLVDDYSRLYCDTTLYIII